MAKQAHLLGFIQHGVNSHATGMWRHPKDKVGWNYARPEYWQHMGRTMERGLFDAMFIADELAPYNTYANSSDETVRWAVQCPTHEPSTIVPIIATATTHLGIGVTLSTAFEHLTRCAGGSRASIICRTGGSPGTSSVVLLKSEWEAYGADITERPGRYERLEEYMELCYKLWDSWEPDAIIADKESGVYADPAKVHEVSTRASTFAAGGGTSWRPRRRGGRCCGRRAPPIAAATSPPSTPRRSSRSIRTWRACVSIRMTSMADCRAGSTGRPAAVKLIFGIQPIVGQSRAEAQEKQELIRSLVPKDGAIALISGHFGLDFSQVRSRTK